MTDQLEFKIVNTNEDWMDDSEFKGNIAEIYINGQEIIPLLKKIEEPYAAKEGHFDIAGAYGHRLPQELYEELTEVFCEGTYAHEEGVELLCCGDCGLSGCWSIVVYVKQDENYVYWYKFRQNHREWEYNLSYKFEKNVYMQALKQLRCDCQADARTVTFEKCSENNVEE